MGFILMFIKKNLHKFPVILTIHFYKKFLFSTIDYIDLNVFHYTHLIIKITLVLFLT